MPNLCFRLNLIVTDSTAIPWKAIRPRKLTNGDPLSQEAIHWVKSRLDICFGNHKTCPLAMGRPFPTRLLALNRNPGGGIYVKVMEVENKDSLGIYATLSHCWGVELPCVLSTENRTNRLCGIPWTELPQTFQDAIRYCLELEISYLWIDALCIIQDDPEDWQIQSARVTTIYENSYITLAATSSDCDSSGFLQQRSAAYKERSLKVPISGGQVTQILIRRCIPHWSFPPTSSSKRENPLLSRGWVFQERILSPRVLHFCKQELVWECGQETVCECGSKPKTQNLKLQFALAARLPNTEEYSQSEQRDEGSSASQINSMQLIDFDSAQESGAPREAINQWHGIVEQYSALDLTKDKDGLPALSGLAERMAPFLGDYLAGLWRRSLLFDLCWRVDKLVYGPQTPVEYRGPSWSWVSTKATVAFWTQEEITPRLTVAEPNQSHSRHRMATLRPSSSVQGSRSQAFRNQRAAAPDIVSCTVDTYGKNKYGEISSAVLIVDGYLKESRVGQLDSFFPRTSAVPPSFGVMVECRDETGGGRDGFAEWSLPFFPDYILSSGGSQGILSSGVHFILTISPNVCLVLLKTSLRLSRDTFIFRRIGILKLSYEHVRYGVDLIGGLQRTRVAII